MSDLEIILCFVEIVFGDALIKLYFVILKTCDLAMRSRQSIEGHFRKKVILNNEMKKKISKNK